MAAPNEYSRLTVEEPESSGPAIRIARPGKRRTLRSRDNSVRVTDETFNAASHFIGAMLALLGGVELIVRASIEAQPWKIVGFAIYSASLLALFCLSTLHHGIEGPDWLERGLRIADYCAIFPLIAGSFTPICLVFLHGSGFGWGLLGTLWFLAACGIALTISAFDHLPRWVTLAMFGTMGWMGAVLAAAIYPDVGLGGVSLIAAGGLAYSAGGVIYDMEWPNPACSEGVFGFHEIFHVFVLLGAGLHYAFMWIYVVPYNPRSER